MLHACAGERKKVKDLQSIIESQKVTEQILVAQLEKFKAQINAASAVIDTNAQQNKVAEDEGNINRKTLRDEENELLIQSLQDKKTRKEAAAKILNHVSKCTPFTGDQIQGIVYLQLVSPCPKQRRVNYD